MPIAKNKCDIYNTGRSKMYDNNIEDIKINWNYAIIWFLPDI